MASTPYRYYCPPAGRGVPPWCRALPCSGHKAGKDQVLVAHVLAYQDLQPWDGLFQSAHRSYLVRARQLLHDMRSGGTE